MKELPLVVEPGRAYEVAHPELTKDHFTPRCIGKALKWSRDEINHPDNIQMLPWKKHREKDQTTPWELQAVLRNGGAKKLWEHANEQIVLKRGNPLA